VNRERQNWCGGNVVEKDALESDHSKEHPTEEEIDKALEDTFPASDPLAWTTGLEKPDESQEGGDLSPTDHLSGSRNVAPKSCADTAAQDETQ
jgi:hypothetical protein